MEALLLGPLELRQDGQLVELGDRLQRLVLVVLLLHANRVVIKDQIIDIVWRDKRPKGNPVPTYVTRIRKSFREAGVPEMVETVGNDGYRLVLDPDNIDAERLVRLCAAADSARRVGDGEGQLTALRAAVALWRGPFLGGLDVGDPAMVSPEPKYLDALGDLAELELKRAEHRLVRDRLQPVVDHDPLRVRLVGLLMRALIANGDQVQGLQVYHRTRDALDEHGIEPPPELVRLAKSAQWVMPPSKLPARRGPWVGRSAEFDEIEAAVRAAGRDGVPAVMWISGPPGIGKSALAVEAGWRLARRFPEHQVRVDLHGFTPNAEPLSLKDALGVLLVQLGVPPEQVATTVDRLAHYRSILAGTRSLVVLDNAASDEQVLDLLPVAPGCACLVTSRRAGGIDAGAAIRLEPLPTDAAAELFARLVGAGRVQDRQQLDAVVARCGGVPLLIRVIAGAFHRHGRWPLATLLESLRSNDARLPDWPFGELGAEAVAVSYGQLSDQQRTMFRLLSTLPGPDLTVAAAAALVGCSVRAARTLLDELLDASLLEETDDERYRLLDPLKEYAAAIEPATPLETDDARDRLLDFQLVTVAEAIGTAYPFDSNRQPPVHVTSPVALRFDDPRQARGWLAAERANLSAAIRSAADRGRTEHVWRLAVLLWRWHYLLGQVTDWVEALDLAKTILDVPGGDPQGLAYVLLRLSNARWVAGDNNMALELAARAMTIWRKRGDIAGEASAYAAIGLVNIRDGDYDGAIAHYEEALRLYTDARDDRGRAYALGNLGFLHQVRGRLDRAERSLNESAGLLEQQGHMLGLAHCLENLAYVEELLGRVDEAERHHVRAGELAVTLGDVGLQAHAVNGLGNVLRMRGRPAEALEKHRQARVLADQINDPSLGAMLYVDRGETFLALGDHRAARTAYLSALDLAEGSREHVQHARATLGVAKAMHLAGDCGEESASSWQAGLAAFDELHLADAATAHEQFDELSCNCRV